MRKHALIYGAQPSPLPHQQHHLAAASRLSEVKQLELRPLALGAGGPGGCTTVTCPSDLNGIVPHGLVMDLQLGGALGAEADGADAVFADAGAAGFLPK